MIKLRMRIVIYQGILFYIIQGYDDITCGGISDLYSGR